MLTPHQVAAIVAYQAIPEGATLLHDCDVRLCVSAAPGHVRMATQGENMRQAASRGRARGPRPGLVDVRGPLGAAHAIQTAMRVAPATATADELSAILLQVLRDGDPLRDLLPLFPSPGPVAIAVPVECGELYPADLLAVTGYGAASDLTLFDL